MPRFPKALEQAACIGWEPVIFDALTQSDAEIALGVCKMCLVRAACLAWMQPGRRYYSGVAGGRVWDTGQAITVDRLPKIRPTRRDTLQREADSVTDSDILAAEETP